MSRYKVHKNVPMPAPPKTIVLSPKAQLYLRYIGIDPSELESMKALRDRYHRARVYNEDSINQITTKTIEQCMRNALTLALGVNMQKENKGKTY